MNAVPLFAVTEKIQSQMIDSVQIKVHQKQILFELLTV